MATETKRIQLRRGLATDLPTLAAGEFGFTTDTRNLYIGSSVGNIRVQGDYITPEMYGAVGDGVTDDTAEIQAAINAAELVGGTVRFASKDYLISSALTVDTDYVTLQGAGKESKIYNTGAGAAVILSSTEHCSIRNLLIWGDGGAYGAGSGTTYGVELSASSHVKLESVDIRYNGSHGLYVHGGCWVISVVDCTIEQNVGDGIHSISPDGTEQNGNNLSVVNSSIFDNAGNGINWKAASLNVVGCVLEANKGAGILSDCTGTTTAAFGLNISGNYFESNWLGQIKFTTTAAVTVSGAFVAGNFFYSDYAEVGGATALIVASGTLGITSSDIGYNSYNAAGALITHFVDLAGLAAGSTSVNINSQPTLFVNLGSANSDLYKTTLYGSAASGGDLALASTSHATKGNILFGTSTYDEVNDRLGVGTAAPGYAIHAKKAAQTDIVSQAVGDFLPTVSMIRTGGSTYTNRWWSWFIASPGELILYDATNDKNILSIDGGGTLGLRPNTGATYQFTYQADALADDAVVAFPASTSGMVLVSCNAEAGMWLVQTSGAVTKISGSTNTAATDADGNLCVYDGGGATAGVKNRLGATGEIRIVYYYN
jgi:hypothetical protein